MGIRDNAFKMKELRLRKDELRLRGEELQQRQWEAKFRSKSELTENGFKGLVLINGGAAVALGALFQAIISKPEAVVLLPYVLVGILLNVFGVAASAVVFCVRYMQLRLEAKTGRYMEQNFWWRIVWGLALLSVVCFVAGLGVAVCGGFKLLDDPPAVQWRPVLPSNPDASPAAPRTRPLGAG